jgi:hypothetical protein
MRILYKETKPASGKRDNKTLLLALSDSKSINHRADRGTNKFCTNAIKLFLRDKQLGHL